MKKLVIIDTDKFFVEKIKKSTVAKELEIFSATNEEDGLQKAKSENTEIIIVGATEKTTDEAFKASIELKKQLNKPISVILAAPITRYSGYKFDPTDGTSYMPVDDFIDKNMSDEELIHKLNSLLNCNSTINGSSKNENN